MKTDETIDPEVRKLLEDLAEPHANQQRQQQLAELIDNLAAQEQPPVTPAKKHTRLWAWVGIAAAAACLLLFIIRMPDSTVENAMPSAPLLADDNKPVEVDTDVVETVSPTHNVASPKVERTELLAEARDVEPIEEAVVPIINDEREDNVIITEEKTDEDQTIEPTRPMRRVVACSTLVCYDCKEPRQRNRDKQMEDKTIFGTPAATHVEGGVLMLASL